MTQGAHTQDLQDAVAAAMSDFLKYSLLGRRIDIPTFLKGFRQGAAAHAGEPSTLGARYAPIGDRFCIPNLEDVCRKINADPAITDVRWASYMLATTYWETAHVVDSGIKRKHGHGDYKVIETFVAVSESGHGGRRAYALPVKVAKAPSGHALVTSQNGEIHDVNPISGKIVRAHRPASGRDHARAAPGRHVYDEAPGKPLVFYGRGYVQLTWWYNYVGAGIHTGRGLDLLYDPELALDADTAYSVMSVGMREGIIFANGHTLVDFFSLAKTDYYDARKMVNGHDHAQEIADIAKAIEACLLQSLDS